MLLSEISWGEDAAEKDKHLLSYSVNTDSYTRLRAREKTLVIGRKGAGKSALRKKLEEDFSAEDNCYVINISPQFASIRNIRNDEKLTHSFGQEIFFSIGGLGRSFWIHFALWDVMLKENLLKTV